MRHVPTSERKNSVYFDYPWRESDTVVIKMPDGFELDNADAPAALNFGSRRV